MAFCRATGLIQGGSVAGCRDSPRHSDRPSKDFKEEKRASGIGLLIDWAKKRGPGRWRRAECRAYAGPFSRSLVLQSASKTNTCHRGSVVQAGMRAVKDGEGEEDVTRYGERGMILS